MSGHPTPPEISILSKACKTFACKMMSHRWSGATYEDLLTITNLPTLERRRLELKLCHLFKIIHNLVYFPSNVVLHREMPHDYYLSQPFARTNSYFYSHVISIWNRLPTDVVSLSSVNIKTHVRSHNFNIVSLTLPCILCTLGTTLLYGITFILATICANCVALKQEFL